MNVEQRGSQSSHRGPRRRIFGARLLHWVGAAGLFFVLLAALGSGLQWLFDARSLPLRVVHIEGDFRHLDRQQLERSVADAVRSGFFTLDVAEIRRAAKRLAWVDEVTVRRVWPDGLRMRVTEQQVLARWGEDGLVNRRGEDFFPKAGSLSDHLPRLSGPQGSAATVSEVFVRMRRLLRTRGLELTQLALDERGAWSAELRQGAKIHLGAQDMETRLARFIRLYPSLMASHQGRLREVDLRYTNGFAVHWEAPPEEAEEALVEQTARGNDRPVAGAGSRRRV